MKSFVTSLITATLVLFVSFTCAAEPKFSPHVDVKGNISLPSNFRTEMAHLGSWFVPTGDASGFHDVYTNPESASGYQTTGKFPDGTVIVKELRAHSTGSYTTGQGVSYANENLKQWFVMVKDSKGRFPQNAAWGDGWGWALFQPGKTGNVSTDYKKDCLGCHVPAKDNDWIYVEAYPTLTKSAAK